MSIWFYTKKLATGVWAIREPNHVIGVISYLVIGRNQAVLIDTGMGIANIRNIVEGLTRLPVLVVNTHAHFDHIGDNYRFEQIAIHEAESKHIEKGIEPGYLAELVELGTFNDSPPEGFSAQNYQIHPSQPTKILKDGEKILLGNHSLEIIHTPGHSPGSICLWEREKGWLFSGDTVFDGRIRIQLPDSDFCAYQESIDRLVGIVPNLHAVFPAHGESPLEPEIILKIAAAFKVIVKGGIEYWYKLSSWGRIRVYEVEGITVYLKSNFRK
jgi:glyoxylase-like metal-dependent hydrolase (beta-lactamase superfamily II)